MCLVLGSRLVTVAVVPVMLSITGVAVLKGIPAPPSKIRYPAIGTGPVEAVQDKLTVVSVMLVTVRLVGGAGARVVITMGAENAETGPLEAMDFTT